MNENMFEHTIRRIFDVPGSDLAAQVLHLRDLNGGKLKITFYAGLGPDGSSGMYSGVPPWVRQARPLVLPRFDGKSEGQEIS